MNDKFYQGICMCYYLPTTVVICIYDSWCRSPSSFKAGHQTFGHTSVAPLRLSCHHHCGQELAPLVQHTGDILHGALAITIYLLKDLENTKQNIHLIVSINNLSVQYNLYELQGMYILYPSHLNTEQ